ncbi:hypothetical protein Ddc_17369 [Ditylenchus destructor]|nr:hypothetical protein Ddc_17369 [Ditylenchus destructor]
MTSDSNRGRGSGSHDHGHLTKPLPEPLYIKLSYLGSDLEKDKRAIVHNCLLSLFFDATVLAFIVIFAIGFEVKAQDCPENEYFALCRKCSDGSVEWTCKTKYPPKGVKGKASDQQCLIGSTMPDRFFCAPQGCYCYSNYARNDAGKCIPDEQCENYKPRPTEES